jgi:hypothetical protein
MADSAPGSPGLASDESVAAFSIRAKRVIRTAPRINRSSMKAPATASILSPSVLEAVPRLRSAFLGAQPFPHVVIEDFLAQEFAQALLSAFPSFDRGNSMGDDGTPGAKSTVDRVRELGPAYQRLDDVIRGEDFLKLIGEITGIDDLLYDPWYLGGGTHENRQGASLDPHVDFNYHPSERWHRRLNLIVYLNPIWQAEWGGNLELFRDPQIDSVPERSVVPVFNRCVIFETSERSWHAFNRITLPESQSGLTRRSIALYFYSRTRPAAETAGRHTTLYVNRQLPDAFAEGRTLSSSDVLEVKQLLAARDAHIQMLYEENTRLRQAQDKGVTGHLLYLAKRAYVRFRR